MPGRGRFWKIGGLNDEHVKEADLTTALQNKVNAGGGISRDTIADPDTDFYFYDEFFYPDPTNQFPHWEKSLGSIDGANSLIGGVTQITSVSAPNSIARINLCSSGLVDIDPTKKFRQVWRINLQTSKADTAVISGFTPEDSFPSGVFPFASRPTPYIQFFFNGSGNWFAQTHDGSTPNSTDTGVTPVVNVFQTFEINFDVGSGNLTFLIDKVQVAQFSTNLPTSALSALHTCQRTTTSASTQIDSFFIFNER